ncbi:MAG TPA: UxaA family hydrolase, partial [Ruminiclostridium sp.]
MKKYIKINEKDNVVVALIDLLKGEIISIDEKEIILKQDVDRGHKIAIEDLKKNDNIIKYGFPIGHSLRDIFQGETVHTSNAKTNLRGVSEYEFHQSLKENPYNNRDLTFKGYVRGNSEVGIRNELWIVPTVGCINGIADKIIERFQEITEKLGRGSVQVFKHNYGCSQLGDDHTNTKSILGNIVKHPNAGGVLVLGLGCENNSVN